MESFYFFSTKQDVVTACYSEIYNSIPFPNQSTNRMYTIYIASRMANPRASPARLQHNKGFTVYTQGIVNS